MMSLEREEMVGVGYRSRRFTRDFGFSDKFLAHRERFCIRTIISKNGSPKKESYSLEGSKYCCRRESCSWRNGDAKIFRGEAWAGWVIYRSAREGYAEGHGA